MLSLFFRIFAQRNKYFAELRCAIFVLKFILIIIFVGSEGTRISSLLLIYETFPTISLQVADEYTNPCSGDILYGKCLWECRQCCCGKSYRWCYILQDRQEDIPMSRLFYNVLKGLPVKRCPY